MGEDRSNKPLINQATGRIAQYKARVAAATRSKTLLLDPRLDKSITEDEYDKKARELKGWQNEIALRIEQHQEGEGEYRATLESLIYVASRGADIFERSKTEQKRELIAFVISNLRLKGKKLEYSLRSPFDLLVNRADHTSWLRDPGFEPR